jgi:dihydromethanopterin reductase
MAYVRAMCAIGKRGQLGLRGVMPWEGAKGPEYIADVERFWDQTRGHVILMGPRTRSSVPPFAYQDRTIVEIRSSMKPDEMIARYPGRVVFIGGGPAVFAAYARFVQHWDVTRLPYDGEADCWFDPKWLTVAD